MLCVFDYLYMPLVYYDSTHLKTVEVHVHVLVMVFPNHVPVCCVTVGITGGN